MVCKAHGSCTLVHPFGFLVSWVIDVGFGVQIHVWILEPISYTLSDLILIFLIYF